MYIVFFFFVFVLVLNEFVLDLEVGKCGLRLPE